jgi:hypothetical protein
VDQPRAQQGEVHVPAGDAGGGSGRQRQQRVPGAQAQGGEGEQQREHVEEPLAVQQAHPERQQERAGERRRTAEPRLAPLGEDQQEKREHHRGDERLRRAIEQPHRGDEHEVGEDEQQREPAGRGVEARHRAWHQAEADPHESERGEERARRDEERDPARDERLHPQPVGVVDRVAQLAALVVVPAAHVEDLLQRPAFVPVLVEEADRLFVRDAAAPEEDGSGDEDQREKGTQPAPGGPRGGRLGGRRERHPAYSSAMKG